MVEELATLVLTTTCLDKIRCDTPNMILFVGLRSAPDPISMAQKSEEKFADEHYETILVDNSFCIVRF